MTPKKPTRTETVVEVGRRLTKRQQTRVQTERGHVIVLDPLDPDESMNVQRIKAKAIALLQAGGVEVDPIESALDRVRARQRPNDKGLYDDDSPPGMAARSLRHIANLELFEAAYGKPADHALHQAYSLGRLSVLMREVVGTTRQTRDAGLKRAKMPAPGSVETDDGKVTKKSLVSKAIDAAGPGAGLNAVWTQLLGVLDRNGLSPVETGAKDDRVIEWRAFSSKDGSEEIITVTFESFKSIASKALKAASSQSPARGRPKGK